MGWRICQNPLSISFLEMLGLLFDLYMEETAVRDYAYPGLCRENSEKGKGNRLFILSPPGFPPFHVLLR